MKALLQFITLSSLLLAFTLTGCNSVTQPLAAVVNPPAVSAAAPTVFHKDFINQVGTIPLTTVATAPADGEYLLSIVITAAPVANPVGFAVGLSPIWTDENGPVNQDFPPFSISGSIPGVGNEPMRLQLTITIHAKSGTPISVFGVTGGDSIHPYNAYVVVQSLQ